MDTEAVTVEAGRAGTGGRRRRQSRRRYPVEVLSPGEVVRLIDAVKGPALTAARNRAIIALAYRSGLRISEVLSLCPKDIDSSAGSIRVLTARAAGHARRVDLRPWPRTWTSW